MKKVILFLSLMLLLGACKSPHYLPKPKKFKHHVKGLTFKIEYGDNGRTLGEIIEVNSKSIIILPISKDHLPIKTILKKDIRSAEIVIATTSDNPEGISTWATLINLAPIGQGYFTIISIPINLATTIPIGIDATKGTYRMHYPQDILWDQMYKFARFPQGIPEHIDITQIR